MNISSLYSLLSIFLISISLKALANDPQYIVCDVVVTDTGVFSWSNFKEGRGEVYLERRDLYGLYDELLKLWNEEKRSNWPESVTIPVTNAISDLDAGLFDLSSFSLNPKISYSLIKTQVLFLHTNYELEVPKKKEDCRPYEKEQALIAATKFVLLVKRSSNEILDPYRKDVPKVIEKLEGVYDKYLFEGYPMFPWEALANSWLLTDKSIANGPPRNQLVLMHPSAGVVGAIGSDSDTDIDAVLSIEPIGWIHYTKDYDTWYGVSLLTVLPSERNAGIGIGLNYKNFKLGVTWHDYDKDVYENPTLFLGLDLYAFINKDYRKYTSYKDKVKDILMERKE